MTNLERELYALTAHTSKSLLLAWKEAPDTPEAEWLIDLLLYLDSGLTDFLLRAFGDERYIAEAAWEDGGEPCA